MYDISSPAMIRAIVGGTFLYLFSIVAVIRLFVPCSVIIPLLLIFMAEQQIRRQE